jgi:hypothetical protein
MDELEYRSREQLRRRVPERAFERGVHAFEVAVDSGHAQQVEREIEDVVHLPLGAAPPQDPATDEIDEQHRRRRPRQGEPRQRRLQPRDMLLGDVDPPPLREVDEALGSVRRGVEPAFEPASVEADGEAPRILVERQAQPPRGHEHDEEAGATGAPAETGGLNEEEPAAPSEPAARRCSPCEDRRGVAQRGTQCRRTGDVDPLGQPQARVERGRQVHRSRAGHAPARQSPDRTMDPLLVRAAFGGRDALHPERRGQPDGGRRAALERCEATAARRALALQRVAQPDSERARALERSAHLLRVQVAAALRCAIPVRVDGIRGQDEPGDTQEDDDDDAQRGETSRPCEAMPLTSRHLHPTDYPAGSPRLARAADSGRRPWLLAIVLIAVAVSAGCGAHDGAPASTDASVTRARAAVDRALKSVTEYRGPASARLRSRAASSCSSPPTSRTAASRVSRAAYNRRPA